MFPKCIVQGCAGSKRNFRVPTDPPVRDLWLGIVERLDLAHVPRVRHCICEKHFRPEMFAKSRLSRTAIPFLEKKPEKDPKPKAILKVRKNLTTDTSAIDVTNNQLNTVQIGSNTVDSNGLRNERCGDILVSSNGTLTLVCAMCAEQFVNLEAFGLHLQTQHTLSDPIQFPLPRLEAQTVEAVLPIPTNNLIMPVIPASDTSRHVISNTTSTFTNQKDTINQVDLTKDEEEEEAITTNCNSGSEKSSAASLNPKAIVIKVDQKSVPDLLKYMEHLKTHSEPLELTCPLCPMKFFTRSLRPLSIQPKTRMDFERGELRQYATFQ